MKASEKKIIKFFSEPDTIFSIPVYQRDYNWQEKHCQSLFDDILRVAKDEDIVSHFIGSIVYIHDGVYSTGDKEINIIDGQQRLTTLTLLFIVIYQKMKEVNNRLSDKIYDQYLINKYSEKEIKLKLFPPEENLIILNNILKENMRELEDYQDTNLVKNYNFFKNKLENFTREDIDDLMLGIEKLIYVDIALEKGNDNPQKIFESLNSTGLDLAQSDLIRNYILMDLERNEQNRIYKEIWLVIEKNCKINDGSKLVSDYIRDYLTLKTGKIPSKPKVFEEFKKFYLDKDSSILEDLKDYSYSYSLILKPELEKNSEVRRELEYLKMLDQTVINPFMIGILKDYEKEKIDRKTLIDMLQLLQSFIWRRYITGEPSNALNSLFQGMYLKVSKSENYYDVLESNLMNQAFPDDDELRHSLKTKPVYKDKEKLNYVFRRLENYYHNELIDFNNEKITIEHIFPQKPNKDWKEKYSSEELEQMLNFKDTISNLTLTGSNSNLSNKSFEFKRDEPIHGYKNSKLYLNKFLGTIDSWNLLSMEERFQILFEDIIKIWKRPERKEMKDLEKITFVLKGPISSGTGKLLSGSRFEILKGSTFSKNIYDSAIEYNIKVFSELKERDMLEEMDNKYLLKENYKVSSPSAAAKLILGRSANGWTEWKTFEGKMLNEYRVEKE